LAKLKGTIFASLKAFINKRFGSDKWQEFLNALPPDERTKLELPVSIGWYDLELVIKAMHVLDDVIGSGDGVLVFEFGRFDAEQDLTTVQRLFLRIANPAYVLEKAGQYWRRFCDFGEWKVERQGKNGASAELVGCPQVDELYCIELTGYLKRMWELVGARTVQVKHTMCRARGDDQCVWVGAWNT
jgi:hypothetical protein